MAAAAATAASRRGGHFDQHSAEALNSIERTVPDDPASIYLDVEVGKQVISALGVQWPERRMIVDHRFAYFCRPSSDIVIDHIPLLEIEELRPLGQETTKAGKANREIADRDPFNVEQV